jgi:predicted DNA-binding WGR domain protein
MSYSFAYYEKHNDEHNEHRFYRLQLHPGLFGWVVIKEWGRIGSLGACEVQQIDDEGEAHRLFFDMNRQRSTRGYRKLRGLLSEGVGTDAEPIGG